MFSKRNILWTLSLVLVVATFSLISGSWSPAAAAQISIPDCVDVYSGEPNFIFNASPDDLKATANDGNCLHAMSWDPGPTFLVFAHAINSGSLEPQAACPQVQFGAPTFIVNPEPTANFDVAGVDDICSPG